MSKSGQFILHTWLPDAMAGPTPVSALIHAATMVVAGVFMVARLYGVFFNGYSIPGSSINLLALIGAVTVIGGAGLAFVQNDIKKVLAYSTVSQLGYMFLAVGSGAYVAAIFHMVTHAFFKALLFLGSGSVIHGMHEEQDMRRMGQLRRWMPVTAATFIVGWLAIAGVPPFAGFWSKDEILLFSLAKSPALYVIGLVTALLTAFYMTRQVIMVFFGEARWKSGAPGDHAAETEPGAGAEPTEGSEPVDEHVAAAHGAHGEFKPHESPWIMLVPLVVLAGLSLVGGGLQLPFSDSVKRLEHWLHEVVPGEADIHETWAYENKYVLLVIAIAVALAGIALGWLVYQRRRIKAVEPEVLAQGWYYDRAVTDFMGGPGREAFEATAWFDANVVDGAVNGTGRTVRGLASVGRKVQSGYVRAYAGVIGIGVVLLLAWFVLVRGMI
jgi:NADH-quinone oxidoreductase subunit L